MAVTKGSTWSSLVDADIEDTMTREEALQIAAVELGRREYKLEQSGLYSEATTLGTAAQILQRIWEETEEENALKRRGATEPR